MSQITIHSATDADIDALNKHLKPAYGRTVQDELDDQAKGEHTLFVAYQQNLLVGSGFLRWLGPCLPEVYQVHPGVPEIHRLEVMEEYRSQGIGTALIAAMEQAARLRGCAHMGLAVAYENPRAFELYTRLGFVTTIAEIYDEYQYQDGDGVVQTVRDLCRYMLKSLGE